MAFEKLHILETSQILNKQALLTKKVFIAFLCSGVLNIVLAATIFLLFPLKEKVPYVVYFSKSDSNFVTIKPIGEKLQGEEALLKTLVASYVSKRETINRIDDEARYLDIRVQSGTEAYQNFLNVLKDENSLFKNTKISRTIKTKNVSFISKNIAQVDFIAELKQNDIIRDVKAFRATLHFVFESQNIPASDIDKNPTGFRVVAYSISEINEDYLNDVRETKK